ncbi:Imm1 family immunity protein [Lentzea sp. NPDC042327]|uniref:Imm1 family immunity protein n=1 Tax=Lentzea sp. NPDC042327 TaxID=3154801 RepID=UPI00340F2F73
MTHTLDVWYHRADDADGQDDPVEVTSGPELEAVLTHVLNLAQPHPVRITARERPDALVELVVAPLEQVGALLFHSPESRAPRPADDTSTGVYATRAEAPVPGAPTLYVDTDTKTPFPTDAALPVPHLLAALEEFRQTGERPTCVEWQETQVS